MDVYRTVKVLPNVRRISAGTRQHGGVQQYIDGGHIAACLLFVVSENPRNYFKIAKKAEYAAMQPEKGTK